MSKKALSTHHLLDTKQMQSKFPALKAARIIQNNGVIAYPTESVYGLGCDPLSEQAVFRILQLKRRPVEKGLIIIASSFEQLEPFIIISEKDKQKITGYDSPMTWLVTKSDHTPHWISGKHKKVAVRICQHPFVIDLCNKLKHPIVSTSANPTAKKPANTLMQARQYFSNQVDMYINGNTGKLKTSTPITDLETNTLIRSS